jgi:8-oxo-dGTP pyrophosphatase MutT (NUDIX family)
VASAFVTGIVTLFRLITRNQRTDEAKRDLDHIRQTFKDHFDPSGRLLHYSPVGRSKGVSDRKFGGLMHMMMAINSLLAAVLIACLLLPFDASFSFQTSEHVVILAIACSLFVFTFLGQWFITESKKAPKRDKPRKQNEGEKELIEVTHAGGVVFRSEQAQVEYLLISPKASPENIWVLPKGHIEKGEDHIETALREVREEANIVARCLTPLDIVQYRRNNEDIRVKYYLMEWLFNSDQSAGEHRHTRWLSFEEAVKALTHPESSYVLQLAEVKRKTLSPLPQP